MAGQYVERNPQTKWREQFESDSRDYTAENTVGDPTPQEIADLPTSINLLDGLPRTYDQGTLGACTAYALTHIQLAQNCKEFDSTLIEMDPLSLWKAMGHDPANKADSGDYLENALKAGVEKGIKGTGPDGKTLTFLASSYAFKNSGSGIKDDFDKIKYYLSKGYPLYAAIKGNVKTRRELGVGELTTVIPVAQTTGGHAIAMFGIDENYLYFANSWSSTTKSTFKIARSTWTEMLKQNMTAWRYWIVYDAKNISTPSLFIDYFKEKDTEEYKAVSRCKDKGIIKGSNGRLLPNEPITREQMCLVLYRLMNPVNAEPVAAKFSPLKTKSK